MDVADVFPYSCETCRDPVLLNSEEYRQRQFKRGRYGARILCDRCNPAVEEPVVEEPVVTVKRQRTPRGTTFVPHGASAHLTLTPKERADYGVIVTIREQTTMELHTFESKGHPKDALNRACDFIDGLEGDWRIVTISGPVSIYRDLQGAHDPGIPKSEPSRLKRIGRDDLLELLPHGVSNAT
jgi:hypothetical protein